MSVSVPVAAADGGSALQWVSGKVLEAERGAGSGRWAAAARLHSGPALCLE